MKSPRTDILLTTLAGVFITVLFWTAGFNFDERGPVLAAYSYFMIFVCGVIWFYPGFVAMRKKSRE